MDACFKCLIEKVESVLASFTKTYAIRFLDSIERPRATLLQFGTSSSLKC